MFANGIESLAVPTIELTRRPPQLVAHRGNAAEFPENTLPALRSALELGIKYVAFDVQLTADSVPVVLRDRTLRRTSDVDCNILDMTSAELARIRVNEPARFGQRFADVGIPTLAQATELFTGFSAALAFIEIHSAGLQQFGPDTVLDRVCDCLRNIADRVVLLASDLPTVEVIRRRSKHLAGWVINEYSALSALKCEAVTPDFLLCDRQLLPDNRSRLWRGPWHWIVGDVTSRAQALHLADRGAEFVRTSQARSLLRELRTNQPHR